MKIPVAVKQGRRYCGHKIGIWAINCTCIGVMDKETRIILSAEEFISRTEILCNFN